MELCPGSEEEQPRPRRPLETRSLENRIVQLKPITCVTTCHLSHPVVHSSPLPDCMTLDDWLIPEVALPAKRRLLLRGPVSLPGVCSPPSYPPCSSNRHHSAVALCLAALLCPSTLLSASARVGEVRSRLCPCPSLGRGKASGMEDFISQGFKT